MKFSMKLLFIGFFFGILPLAQAKTWQKILICEDGQVVVDVNLDERKNVQLVVRGDNLLRELHNAAMVSLQYGQHEWLIGGEHAELRQTTSTETYPISLGGIFYSHDFKKLIWEDWSGHAMEAELVGTTLALKKLSYSAGTKCDYEFEGECRRGTYYRTYSFEKEYIFQRCQRM